MTTKDTKLRLGVLGDSCLRVPVLCDLSSALPQRARSHRTRAMEELRGGNGLVVRVGDDGTLRVGWREADWFGPAGLSVGGIGQSAPTLATRSGDDDLGAYTAVDLRWSVSPALLGSVRAYRDHPLIVFRLAAPDGLAGGASGPFELPRVAWPHFHPRQRETGGVPADARIVRASVVGVRPAGLRRRRLRAGFSSRRTGRRWSSPFLLIAPDGRTLLLGAARPLPRADQRRAARCRRARRAASRAAGTAISTRRRAGFATELALWAAPTPRVALDAVGGAALPARRHRAALALRRRRPRAPLVLDRQRRHLLLPHRAGLDCTTTLERAVADCEARGIPIELVQVDSWFYPHEHLRPVSDEGAPIVPPSGMMRWEPREDLFPDGFATLRERLGGRPLAFHSRHFSSALALLRAPRGLGRRRLRAPERVGALRSPDARRPPTGARSPTSRTGSSKRSSACAVCAPRRVARAAGRRRSIAAPARTV